MAYEITFRQSASSEDSPVQIKKIVDESGQDVTTRFDAWTKSKGLTIDTAGDLSEAVGRFIESENKGD